MSRALGSSSGNSWVACTLWRHVSTHGPGGETIILPTFVAQIAPNTTYGLLALKSQHATNLYGDRRKTAIMEELGPNKEGNPVFCGSGMDGPPPWSLDPTTWTSGVFYGVCVGHSRNNWPLCTAPPAEHLGTGWQLVCGWAVVKTLLKLLE
jgi:hypothetical protein